MSQARALRKLAAVGVHTLTLSGAVLALAAIALASDGNIAASFLLLGIALLVDAVDGPLARRLDIATLLARWRGDILDYIVDYLTYVFVPAFIVYTAGLVPEGWNLFAGALICLSAGFYFADATQKTDDNFFKGFPALWNVVVFYIVAFALHPFVALGVILLFTAATFVPLRFVHPVRVRAMRPVTLAMTLLWAVCAALVLLSGMRAGFWPGLGLALTAIYFVALTAARATPFWRT